MKSFTVEANSGRLLEAIEGGNADGMPIFFLHGTPGSRFFYGPQAKHAEKNNIRLISYSRPGYGNSTRHHGRSVSNAAQDVKAIADHLGIERFAVWGFSGGGPHALACASILPKRVVAASSLASLAPFDAEGLDFYDGMGEYNIEDFKLLQSDEKQWEENNLKDVTGLLNAGQSQIPEMLGSLFSEVDRKSLTKTMLRYLVDGWRDGAINGIYGLKDDNISFVKNWGFSVEDIKVPMQIWQGEQDMFVPFSHGKWLAEKVPLNDTRLVKGQGHISMFANFHREIQEWLANKF